MLAIPGAFFMRGSFEKASVLDFLVSKCEQNLKKKKKYLAVIK